MKNYKAEIYKILVKKQFRDMPSIKDAYKEPIDKIASLIREIVKEAVGEEIEHFIDDKGRYIGKENYHNKYRSEILSNVEEMIK